MKSLLSLLLVLCLFMPIEAEALGDPPATTVSEGEGQPLVLAQRRRRRRKRRPRRKKRRRTKKKAKKTVVPKKKAKADPKPEPKPVTAPEAPVLPTAVLADLSVPAELQAQWASPLAEGFVKGLLESKSVSLLTGEPLRAKLGESGSTTVVNEDGLEALRQQSGAEVAYWIQLEMIKDRVRLTAVRSTAKVAIAFSRLLGPQVPEAAWFQAAAQALMTAKEDSAFPAAPVASPEASAPEVSQEDKPKSRAGAGSGLMIAGMGILTAGFGMSVEADAARMESADNADTKSMQNSIADSRRVGERLVLGGYTLAGLGLARALWTVVRGDG